MAISLTGNPNWGSDPTVEWARNRCCERREGEGGGAYGGLPDLGCRVLGAELCCHEVRSRLLPPALDRSLPIQWGWTLTPRRTQDLRTCQQTNSQGHPSPVRARLLRRRSSPDGLHLRR